MAKAPSTFLHLLGRFGKGLVGALLIPPVIGFALGLYRGLEPLTARAHSCADWFLWGVMGYVALHLLFYKPTVLFRASHALLARLAGGLFGGQVATVDPDAPAGSKPKAKSKGSGKSGGSRQGSTLVALSPYLVPLAVILVSLGAWAASHWVETSALSGVASLLLGVALTFHLAMTAEDLQQDRARFPVELYLMALALSGLASLLVAICCLPLAVPGFSIPSALADAMASDRAMYTAIIHTLFF